MRRAAKAVVEILVSASGRIAVTIEQVRHECASHVLTHIEEMSKPWKACGFVECELVAEWVSKGKKSGKWIVYPKGE